MSAELIASFAPALVVAVLLVPLAAFLTAMLFEGKGNDRWGKIRRATRKVFVSQPLRLPVWRSSPIGANGLGFGGASAAPHEHD